MVELLKLIYENRRVIVGDRGYLSKSTLEMVRAFLTGEIDRDFELTRLQKQLIVEAFLISNNTIHEKTASFIAENKDCISASLERDVRSIDFIKVPSTGEFNEMLLQKVSEGNYILNENSPAFLTHSFEVARHSIELDCFSANYVNWDLISGTNKELLVEDLVHSAYVLTSSSPLFLIRNPQIVLASIKRDKKSIEYASFHVKHIPLVFDYIVSNHLKISKLDMEKMSLASFKNPDVMNYYLENYDQDADNKKYRENFSKAFYDAIFENPTISGMNEIFQVVLDAKWEDHRLENIDLYENVFGKICTNLRSIAIFDDFFDNLEELLDEMKKILGEKFPIFCKVAEDYFNIYHSNDLNREENLRKLTDLIGKMSALYVASSKEKLKKSSLDKIHDWLKGYFVLRKDHGEVVKKVIYKKQREEFCILYKSGDVETKEFLRKVATHYSEVIDSCLVWRFIEAFVSLRTSKAQDIVDIPDYYQEYLKYEKAIKLVHRLNSGFINYNGPEVYNYRDLISFDDEIMEYIYTGRIFTEDEVKEVNEFRRKESVFQKIKKDITLKIKSLDVTHFIHAIDYDSLTSEFPFTDEYFEFNLDHVLRNIKFNDLVEIMALDNKSKVDNFVDDVSFHSLYHMFAKNGLVWLMLLIINDNCEEFISTEITFTGLSHFINHIKTVTDIASECDIHVDNFKELFRLYEIRNYVDGESIAILGMDVAQKICNHIGYTSHDEKTIVKMAVKLLCEGVKREKSTVPYISGEEEGYHYSLYDAQDETILLAGINTDACFKVDGIDNDFLHYCVLDKNGFVIKITDYEGNFIARAGGFRHGHCVFINQLRTIYDECGDHYNGTCSTEKASVIAVFKKACFDMIQISYDNPYEKDKIDFVFVTKSYSLSDYPETIPNDLKCHIGAFPMDTFSNDWKEFVDNTLNLKEVSNYDSVFSTDYTGTYDIICIASSKEELPEAFELQLKDVPALYERKRNPVLLTGNITKDIIQKLNRVKAIYSYLNAKRYESVFILENEIACIGDNWYLLYKDGEIVDSCVLESDRKAKEEFEFVSAQLRSGLYQVKEGVLTEKIGDVFCPCEEKMFIKKRSNG